MEKTFNPKETEEKIYKMWESGGYFTPEIDLLKKPYTVLLPPPNANDPLHMGHALYVVEDILCRYHRMLGDPTLWLPGFDHAGIETQFVFEKKLAKENKSRFDFDREILFKMISDYVDQNRGVAKSQLKRLGFSLDWTREKYTMDPDLLKTVYETFKKLHEDGLLYRKKKVVNFCPHCGTAYSNLEVEYEEEGGRLWYIRYPLSQEFRVKSLEFREEAKDFITVATTRPETMLGDTAVAVNPKDRRYKNLVGKTCILPLVGREIPIIADSAVDPNFGVGVLKVTPAHAIVDEEIAERHKLESEVVIGQNGKISLASVILERGALATSDRISKFGILSVAAGDLQDDSFLRSIDGLKIEEARSKIVEELKKEGLLEKEETITHSVGHCYRCGRLIEQLPLPQWFVKIKPLVDPAIAAVKSGRIKIVPKRFEKTYLQWMENIRDWNISRQIVWGPRIPVWYCLKCNPKVNISFISNDKGGGRGEASQLQEKQSKLISGTYAELSKKYSFEEIREGLQTLSAPEGATYFLVHGRDKVPPLQNNENDLVGATPCVARGSQGNCPKCGCQEVLQETDTFDTWFSSGQWPLTTLNFPDGEDFRYFYPTSVLDTMWDILFFWVARMIMFGLYLTKDYKEDDEQMPFSVAHMHSRVVDAKGQKMSKSKNNVIDPMVMVEKYGADALRMALVFGTAPGSDISVSEDKIRAYRNFANKIWNASRFVLSYEAKIKDQISNIKTTNQKVKMGKEEERILADLEATVKQVTSAIEKYRFGQASEEIYAFFWHEFCDRYIEAVKPRLQKEDEDAQEAAMTLFYVLQTSLKLLHPFMPFVTEEVWQKLREIDPTLEESLMVAEWPVGV